MAIDSYQTWKGENWSIVEATDCLVGETALL